jgi:ankyrin repeat protein
MANTEAVHTLIELGAMPDPRNSAGQTPLHIAALHDLMGLLHSPIINF